MDKFLNEYDKIKGEEIGRMEKTESSIVSLLEGISGYMVSCSFLFSILALISIYYLFFFLKQKIKAKTAGNLPTKDQVAEDKNQLDVKREVLLFLFVFCF